MRHHRLGLVLVVALGALTIAGLAAAFVNWQNGVPEGGVLRFTVGSPTGRWVVQTYELNGGAAGTIVERADLIDTSSRARHYIWFGRPLPSPPTWTGENTILIGEQLLDVRRDTYDWRTAKPAPGLQSPETAVSSYLRAVADGNLAESQRASAEIVTEQVLQDNRLALFGTRSRILILGIGLSRLPEGFPSDQQLLRADVTYSAGEETSVHLSLDVLAVEEGGTWRVNNVTKAP